MLAGQTGLDKGELDAGFEPGLRMAVDHVADEAALLDLERAWVQAEIEKDADTLARILDDRFLATFSSGRTLDKTAFIAIITGDDSHVMLSCDFSDARLIVDADTAVIVDTATMRGTRDGAPYTAPARVTTTYIKRDGAWRILAEHLNALAGPSLSAAESRPRHASAATARAIRRRPDCVALRKRVGCLTRSDKVELVQAERADGEDGAGCSCRSRDAGTCVLRKLL